jgi:hypothetical protein
MENRKNSNEFSSPEVVYEINDLHNINRIAANIMFPLLLHEKLKRIKTAPMEKKRQSNIDEKYICPVILNTIPTRIVFSGSVDAQTLSPAL